MAITFRYAAGGGTAYPGPDYSRPPFTADGDLMVLMVVQDGNQTAPTPAAGWTLLGTGSSGSSAMHRKLYVFAKVAASEPGSGQYTFPNAVGYGAMVTYRGAVMPVRAVATAGQSATTMQFPSVGAVAGDQLLIFGGANSSGIAALTPPAGMTERIDTASAPVGEMLFLADSPVTSTGATGGRTVALGTTTPSATVTVALQASNVAPNAPTISVPAALDKASVNRISVPFSDPDPGDSQSQIDFQWWDLDGPGGARVGGPHLHTEEGPNQHWDTPADTFTLGDKEMQAKSYDSQGAASAFGPSAFFLVGTKPSAPVIVVPVNGGDFAQTQPLEWVAANQDAYQVQTLDDLDAVVTDTGEVTSTTTRTIDLSFPDNGVERTIRVRRKYAGLWSDWYSVSGTVSWTAPTTPVVTLTPDPDAGALLIGWTNPAPTGDEPATAYNEVWVNDGDGLVRVATNQATNSTWTYWLPISGRDYDGNVVVRAVATNGVTADSA